MFEEHLLPLPASPMGFSTSDHMTLFIHIGGKEWCELQANHDYDDDDVMKKKLNNFYMSFSKRCEIKSVFVV